MSLRATSISRSVIAQKPGAVEHVPGNRSDLNVPRNYDIYFVLDAVLWCTVATWCLVRCVEGNSAIYLLVVGFSESKLGLIAHESCHNCCPRFLSFLYDCAMGSRLHWIHKHNKQHHLFTNTRKDPDIDASPVLRIHPQDPWFWYHRYQWFYQYILFCIIPISLRFNGVFFLLKNGSIGEIILHFILSAPATYLYIVRPVQLYGLYGLRFFVISNAILGLIYGCIFSVSHINDMVEFDPKGSLVERQMKSTADWGSGSVLCNYLSGGLNHQVIHHLYPHLPSYALPYLAREMNAGADEGGDDVKKFFKNKIMWDSEDLKNKKGLYKVMGGLLDALRSNSIYLQKMGCSEKVVGLLIGVNFEAGKIIDHVRRMPNCLAYANCQISMDAPFAGRVADDSVRIQGRSELAFKKCGYDDSLVISKLSQIVQVIKRDYLDENDDAKLVIQIARGKAAASTLTDIISPVLKDLEIRKFEIVKGYRTKDYYRNGNNNRSTSNDNTPFVFLNYGVFGVLTDTTKIGVGEICNPILSFSIESSHPNEKAKNLYLLSNEGSSFMDDPRNILNSPSLQVRQIALFGIGDNMPFITPYLYDVNDFSRLIKGTRLEGTP